MLIHHLRIFFKGFWIKKCNSIIKSLCKFKTLHRVNDLYNCLCTHIYIYICISCVHRLTIDRNYKYISLYTIEIYMICRGRQKDTWMNDRNSFLGVSPITYVHWEKLKHFFQRESAILAKKNSPWGLCSNHNRNNLCISPLILILFMTSEGKIMSLLLSKKAPLNHFNIITGFKGENSFHMPIPCLSKPWKAYSFFILVWVLTGFPPPLCYSQQNSDYFFHSS